MTATPTTFDDGSAVRFSHGGVEIARYVHRPGDVQLESPRPYLHPVRTLGGELVTLLRPHDHVWHKGISWSLPHVGAHNFWGGPTYVRDQGYEQLANNGAMVHETFAAPWPGGGSASGSGSDAGSRVDEELRWETQDAGDVVVREHRHVGARVLDEQAWVLDFRSEMTNVCDVELPLGSPTTHGRPNAGYGGLFWRGPRAWTDATLLAPAIAGGDELRGQRAPWMGCSGRHDGNDAASTLVIVDRGDNPGGVPRWFARSAQFAALCPAPFFSQEVAFLPGQTLTFAYAVVVADGPSDPDRAAELVSLI